MMLKVYITPENIGSNKVFFSEIFGQQYADDV